MKSLTQEQQETFNRFAVKATSIGLIRADMGWYWANSYRVGENDKVTIGCQCNPNIENSPVIIILMAMLPSTGKYAKYESKSYSIEDFESMKSSDFITLSNHVQSQSNEIEELEEKLELLRKDLKKYVKKNIP